MLMGTSMNRGGVVRPAFELSRTSSPVHFLSQESIQESPQGVLTSVPTPISAPAVSFPQFGPPAFNPGFHRERREKFLAQLPPNTAVILVGGEEIRRNNDVNYPFRQQNNFYYLTGFDEPNAVAVLQNVPGQPTLTMFVRPKDPAQEVWTGRRAGPEGAKNLYGANAAFTIDQLSTMLPSLLQNSQQVQMVSGESSSTTGTVSEPSQRLVGFVNQMFPGRPMGDATEIVREMRVIKTPYELALLRQACQISAHAHARTMRTQKLTQEKMNASQRHSLGRNEGEIQARVEYDFRRHGAVRVGYPSITGAGKNGCVLHYETNSEFSKPGDLVLLDAGAEYGYYSADVTRTWPVSGKFSPEQKAVYNVVLKAQEAGIAMVRPGVTLEDIHNKAVEVVTEGLISLGLLQGTVPELIRDKAYAKYFMHGTSHFLGMDVHDVSGKQLSRDQGKKRPLEPGMVLTVEPGIYIDSVVGQKAGLDPKWWNIGIRIEDDILVTPTGSENLSAGAPKTVEAIEAVMNAPKKVQ